MNNQEANSLNNNLSLTCSCHIINPKVHRLILWKEVDPETREEKYTLRLGSQRFTSLNNTDKNGQTYWRFKGAGFFKEEKEITSTISEKPTISISKTTAVNETTNSAESLETSSATNE